MLISITRLKTAKNKHVLSIIFSLSLKLLH